MPALAQTPPRRALFKLGGRRMTEADPTGNPTATTSRPPKRRAAAMSSLVVAGVLALTGCSGGEPSPASAEQTLNVGRAIAPDTLDPHKSVQSTVICQVICSIYDRLIVNAPDGTLQPHIAESWEYSEDGLTLTLKIRDDVTFGDGTVLDAEGVKLNLDRAREGKGSLTASDLAAISAIAATDAQTVKITLKSPDSRLPGMFSSLPGVIINPTAIKNGTDLSRVADGSGAFEVVSYTPDSELKLKRNDHYWGPPPTLSQLQFTFIADQAALANALLAGQVDIAELTPQNVVPFENDNRFTIKTLPALSYDRLIFNIELAGLTDLRARQAIIHAIDREGNCKNILRGYCNITDQIFPEGYPTNDGTIDQVLYPFDPDKARELLAAAGVSDLKLTALVSTESLMPMAQAVQGQLAAVGVKLDLQRVDSATQVQQMYIDKTAPATFGPHGGQADPARQIGVTFSSKGFINPGGFTTPRLGELYNQILASTDSKERTTLIQAASREAAEAALNGPILDNHQLIYVMKSGIDTGFATTPSAIRLFDHASVKP